MFEWMEDLKHSIGYTGILVLMFLENLFPFIPSETIMPLAGFMTTGGKLSFPGVVAAGMAGSLIGNLPLYYLGRRTGKNRLKRWADKYGKWLGVSGKDIDRADRWFDRHGKKTVFLCRLVPGVRSLISIPAGFAGMKLREFLLYSAIGVGLWTAFLAYIGRLLGKNYELIEKYMGPVSYIMLGLLLIACIVRIYKRKKEMDRKSGEMAG